MGKKQRSQSEKAKQFERTKKNKMKNLLKEIKTAGGKQVDKLTERLNIWKNNK